MQRTNGTTAAMGVPDPATLLAHGTVISSCDRSCLPIFFSAANAQSYSFSNVRIEGNQRVECLDPALCRNRPRPGGLGRRAERRLSAHRRLGPVRNGRSDAAGRHAGDPGPGIPDVNVINFEGNKRLKDEKLAELIQSQPRRVYSPAQAEADAAAIAEAYRHGRPHHRHGRSADHPPVRQPRRSGVRDHRRQRGRDRAAVLRRQPRLFRPPPAAGAGNQAGRAPAHLRPARHLHRRAAGTRQATADRLLPLARLHRFRGAGCHGRSDARARRASS